MRAANPALIPRNHLVEEAISAAVNDGWDAGLEHGRIVGRLAPCESEIGFADTVEGCEGIWTAAVPSAFQRNPESIEAAPCYVDQQLVAVAEMPVGRRRAHSCPASSFREGEAGGSLLRDQFQRRADWSLLDCHDDNRGDVRLAWTSSCEESLHDSERAVDIGEPSTSGWIAAVNCRSGSRSARMAVRCRHWHP
jgi:hypothetical protein